MRNRPLFRFTFLTLAAASLAGAAGAQEVAPLALTPAATEQAPAKKNAEEEIFVTGSRVRRKDLSTPAPITVVTREQIASSGIASLGDFLQQMPENTSSNNTNVNNGGNGTTTISLRNLGSARTLVLVDGKRYVNGGSGAGSSVDLNSIPSSAVERIEVLKDGASAVYGTDAIGGVVNIITRHKVNGVEANAYTGATPHGDSQQTDVSVTGGVANEKGSFMFTAAYYDQKLLFAGDRSWATKALSYDYSTGKVSNGGSGSIPNGRFRFNPATCTGVADPVKAKLCSDLVALETAAGVTGTQSFMADPTSALGYRLYGADDPYNFQSVNYLITPSTRISLFANGDYKIGETVRAYFQGSLVNRQSTTALAPEPLTAAAATISKDNAYNPFGIDIVSFGRRMTEAGARGSGYDLNTARVVVGIDGTLPETFGPLHGMFFDVSFNYGRNSGYTTNRGAFNTLAIGAALGPSYLDKNGVYQCGVAGGPKVGVNCVPANIFGPNTLTPSMINALGSIDGTSRGWTQVASTQANVSQELFKIMSEKPVVLAAGYEFRAEYGGYVPDALGLVGLSTDYNGLATKGSFHVNEGYAELIIPVASKQPFIDELELQAAARIFNYNTFGTDSIYKFEGRYRPVRDFTVRGTFSTGFRAPGISDLYSGTQPNFPSAKDPCAKLTAGSVLEAQCKASAVGSIAANNGDPNSQIASTVGGNPLLKPETATTATLGVVFEPQFFKGFSATVDFWNVSLEQSLSTIGTAVIVAGCYPGADKSGAAITPNATYCGLITRSPLTGQITDVKDLEQNVGKEARQGLDFAARYQFPAASYGKIGVQADLTYLLTYDTTLATGKVIHGAGNYDLGLAPKVKANVGVSYAMDAFSAFLRARIVGGFTECADSSGGNTSSTGCTDQNTYAPDKTAPTVVVPYPTHEVPAQVTFDLSLSYKLKNPLGVTTFSAGVRNLLDSAPPTVYNSFLSYADTGYDFMGRFIYFRLGQQF